MILNKPQAKFVAEILNLAGNKGNLRIGFNVVTHVTTSIKIDGLTYKLTSEEVVALRNKIYNLELTLMASDPDTKYDFSVVTE